MNALDLEEASYSGAEADHDEHEDWKEKHLNRIRINLKEAA